ncbi:hypothetical protein GCM10019016_034180 [Streptomyces prasinosporus]|uniref:Uncharacterized protein n=1 Tax=Streptomyces prasinosporus TaxID=68256 RepID=A0ABP6TPB0_9ACTN|nr:hypothetical protein GCM10010332_33970 [Streptomyces albogriseolus]
MAESTKFIVTIRVKCRYPEQPLTGVQVAGRHVVSGDFAAKFALVKPITPPISSLHRAHLVSREGTTYYLPGTITWDIPWTGTEVTGGDLPDSSVTAGSHRSGDPGSQPLTAQQRVHTWGEGPPWANRI